MQLDKFLNNQKKRIAFIIFTIISIYILLFIYYKIYSMYHIGIRCIFYTLTKLYCPGCGITRAFFSLIRFKFKEALHYNLLVTLFLPFILIYILLRIINWINFNNKEIKFFNNRFWNFLLIITIIFGILRNIKLFDFLAPI